MNIITFVLDHQYFGLNLSYIERVIRIVALTHQPNAPEHIIGMVNVQGAVIPVVDMRRLLGFPTKEVSLSDQLVISNVQGRRLALLVDGVVEVVSHTEEELLPANEVFAKKDAVDWVIKDKDRITLVYDLEKLLPMEACVLV